MEQFAFSAADLQPVDDKPSFDPNEPKSYQEAIRSNDANKWRAAMDDEFQSLIDQGTWELVDLPPGRKAIPGKWVYKIKYNNDETIERYKARFVAKGYKQVYGLDYESTYAPTSRATSHRIIFALAQANGWDDGLWDVNTAYLNGKIDAEIYIQQPEGYVNKQHPNKVLRLVMGLYGIKQAGKCWGDTFNEYVVGNLKFNYCSNEICLYKRKTKLGFVFFARFVDDIHWTGDPPAINEFHNEFTKRFKIRNQGSTQKLLNIEVIKRDGKTILTQRNYIKKIVKEFNLQDSTPIYTPISKSDIGYLNTQLDDSKFEPADITEYRHIVGSCNYVAVSTRPDISFAVSTLARYSANPSTFHRSMALRLVRYLNHTQNLGLAFQSNPTFQVTGYSDSDFANFVEDRKSISGWAFFLQGAPISWSSKRQSTVTTSSTEAEYVALASAAREAKWLVDLFDWIGKPQKPITIYEDNQSTIKLALNPRNHQQTKSIDISNHYTQDQIKLGNINVSYIPTKDQIADIFTKALPNHSFEYLRNKLGLLMV